MTDVNVLAVFYSRYGETERLALAAGLGAIQARAKIRLRRVADQADEATIAASADWRQNLARMNRDYVTPRPADAVWADVIVLATPADTWIEMEAYVDSLSAIGPMRGKLAAPLAPRASRTSLLPIYVAAAGAGLIVVPAPAESADPGADCRTHGRWVAEIARTLKGAVPPEP